MEAEITFECVKDLPANIEAALAERFNRAVDKGIAMNATVWRQSLNYEDQVVFWHLFNQLVFLVFRPDPSTLKIHLENTYDKTNLRLLKKHIEETSRKIELFLKKHDNNAKRIEVTIWAEEDDFQSGFKQSRRDKLKQNVKDNLWAEIYVP
ncbi:MAG TPA: hypothetical protein VGK38_07755, partial [Prolixibacteraceae bacterium]